MPDNKKKWWVGEDGERLGPYSLTTLRDLISVGKVSESDLVWRDGFDDWKRVGDVTELSLPPPLPDGTRSSKNIRESETPAETNVHADRLAVDHVKPNRKPNQSYFLRHWHGHLSLPVSYWINMYLLTVLIIVSINMFLGDLSFIDSRAEYAGLLVFFIFLIALTVWQTVGVWRSAQIYIQNGRPAFWARTAQVLCVVGVLGSATQYLQYVEMYAEYVRIVFGTDDYSDFELRLSSDGTEIQVSGAFGFGLVDEFENMLTANPDVFVIHLNSRGGRIAEARKLREVISNSDRSLATYTSTDCISACTIAYLGGQLRLLKDSARLGFHRYRFPGLTDADFEQELAAERAYMRSHGIEESFVRNATSQLAEDMWYPSHDDLLQSGFVHEITSGQDLESFGTSFADIGLDTSKSLVDQLDEEWETNDDFEMFRLLESENPGIKAKFLVMVQEIQQSGGSWDDFLLASQEMGREIGASYALKYFAFAQDSELLVAIRVLTEVLEALLAQPGDDCYTWMFGGASTSQEYSDPQLVSEMSVALTKAIESAIKNPASPVGSEESEFLIELLFQTIKEREGAAALEDLALMDGTVNTLGERRRACSAALAMYRTTLSMEGETAAKMLRIIFAAAE